METTRDRSRRQREDIDMSFELLQGLLVCDTKSMFLIDHEESKPAKSDILREEPMSSDDDIDISGLHAVEDTFLLASTRHTCE